MDYIPIENYNYNVLMKEVSVVTMYPPSCYIVCYYPPPIITETLPLRDLSVNHVILFLYQEYLALIDTMVC